MQGSTVLEQLERLGGLLAEHRDVLEGRVNEREPPLWSERRGWTEFLLGLDDDEVSLAERCGPDALTEALRRAPSTLAALYRDADALTHPFAAGPHHLDALEELRVPLRKRVQVAALVDDLRALAVPSRRIVDLGTGHGHLARALRRELDIATWGVDSDGARIAVARALAGGLDVTFVAGAAEDTNVVVLTPGDLVVGLHACGALGDTLLARAAEGRAAVLLISCCQQKIDQPERRALSARGRTLELSYPRPLLGLTNLSYGEAALDNVRARGVRHALSRLLRARGLDVSVGDVAHGINKRRFRHGLSGVADTALSLRGQPPATSTELAAAIAESDAEFAVIRRLSLPRSLLGRVMELALVVDRAAFLIEQGYRVEVRPLFDITVSPRNLGIIARPA